MNRAFLSFRTTQNALVMLNYFYVALGFLLVVIGGYVRSASMVTSIPILGGIITAGVFLGGVALLGIYGAKRQHQVSLFFYMVILCGVFIIQFCVAIACLGNVPEESVNKVVEAGWNRSSKAVIYDAEKTFGCCGLRSASDSPSNCKKLPCWENGCVACLPVIVEITSGNLFRVGILSLFFSFTELFGIWLAHGFRNIRDPSITAESLFH